MITYGPYKINVKDMNQDGYKDIIVQMTRIFEPPLTYWPMLHVYYCGPVLDSIPDQIVNKPEGASKYWGSRVTLIKDFDGDGDEELAVMILTSFIQSHGELSISIRLRMVL
jgi:hypothetical protein